MSALLGLLLFLACAVRAQDYGCASIFPNTMCHSKYTADKPIITSNLDCDTCYSANELRASRNGIGEPLSDAFPLLYKELYSGFDFIIECETSSVLLYRSLSSSVARCTGHEFNRTTGDCITLGDYSMRFSETPCQYSIRSGESNLAPSGLPTCGRWSEASSLECDTCTSLPNPSSSSNYNNITVDCLTGLVTIWADELCLNKTTELELGECRDAPATNYGVISLQVLPVAQEELELCTHYFGTLDCTDEPYIDCDYACGSCLDYNISMVDENVKAFYTDCNTFETTFYSSYHCASTSVVTGAVPIDSCVSHDGGSLKFTRYIPA